MLEGRPARWDQGALRSSSLTSVLADDLIACGLIPLACPCDFGPDARYRLEELVAAGNRSLVYRAKDTLLSSEGFNADVAVKVFRPGRDRSHEALTGRRITHPNVLRVLDRGVNEDGYPYIVSEFIEGGDLSNKPVPWDANAVALFMVKLCRGVQAAHAAGVVHCDLKPANVMLTKDHEPKLADFDLARSQANPDAASRGNLAFMAPEQYAEEENSLAPPADIYALGGLLYYLITGKLAHGETAAQVEAFHTSSAMVPLMGRAPELDAIVRRAMARSIHDRYPSAAQLADDLEAWLDHKPIAWMNPSPLRRLTLWSIRHPAKAVASGAMVVVAVAGLWAWKGVVERDHQRELQAQAKIVREADAKVEEIKGKVRAHMHNMIGALDAKKAEEMDQRMLPALTWIEWITDDPVISSTGEIAVVPGRITLLQQAVARAEEEGRGRHTDACLARFALAQLLIWNNQSAQGAAVLDALDEWSRTLSEDDPVKLALGAMHACVQAEDLANEDFANKDADAKARLAALEGWKARLEEKPGTQRARKLVDRVIARATPSRR